MDDLAHGGEVLVVFGKEIRMIVGSEELVHTAKPHSAGARSSERTGQQLRPVDKLLGCMVDGRGQGWWNRHCWKRRTRDYN